MEQHRYRTCRTFPWSPKVLLQGTGLELPFFMYLLWMNASEMPGSNLREISGRMLSLLKKILTVLSTIVNDAGGRKRENHLEDPSFHIVWRKNWALFLLEWSELGLVGSRFIDLKPKNFSRINNQFGSLAQSCSACSGFWGSRESKHSVWMMGCVCRNAPRGHCPLCGLFPYTSSEVIFSRFWVYMHRCVTELVVFKRFLEIIFPNPFTFFNCKVCFFFNV